MKTDDKADTIMEQSDDEFFFASFDQIKRIEKVIVNLETALCELRKVEEGMKVIEN